jgi:hypothetical protein
MMVAWMSKASLAKRKKSLQIRFRNVLSKGYKATELKKKKIQQLSSATARDSGKYSPLGRGCKPIPCIGYWSESPLGFPGLFLPTVEYSLCSRHYTIPPLKVGTSLSFCR